MIVESALRQMRVYTNFVRIYCQNGRISELRSNMNELYAM